MNLYKRYLSDITRFNGISVSMYDRIPENVGPHTYKLLQKHKVSGWYDKEKECVCLYSPNVLPEESSINSNVVYLYVKEKGLKALMKDRFDDFCTDVVKGFYPQARMLGSKECESMAMEYLSGIPANDRERWRHITSIACRYSYFPMHDRMIGAIASGHHAFLKKAEWEARMNNDHVQVDRKVKDSLGNMALEKVHVSFGRLADPFLRIGYPEAELRLRSSQVREFLFDNGLLDDGAPNLSEIVQNPMAIVKGENRGDKDKIPLNILITDHFVPGKGFLSFGLDSTESILAGYGEGSHHVSIRSAKFMSEYAVLCAVSGDDGRNICYLKPGKTHGYEISSYLSRMEGRSFSELGKKGGDGNTPVINPLSESRRLKVATNIVNNFKNPMASDTRRKFFGGILFEDNLNRRQEVRKELKRMSEKPVVGYSAPAPSPVKASKTVSARTVYFSERDFSAAAIRKLRKAGIGNAFEIMTYGKERFVKDFGVRAFQSAVDFLDRNNLSFMNHSVIRRIDESVFLSKDKEGRLEIVQKDMFYAFSGLDEKDTDRTVRYPRRIDGSYIQGAGCFTMIAKSLSLARWRDCNVYATRQELEEYGISPNPNAVATYVVEGGDVKAYYNLAETSYALEHTESFEMLKQDALSRTAEIDRYAKVYVYGLSCKGSDQMTFSIDLIDEAYARHYDRGKALGNNGPFVSHLKSSMPERISQAFKEGFKMGKAEGISIMAEHGRNEARQQDQGKVRKVEEVKKRPSGPKR